MPHRSSLLLNLLALGSNDPDMQKIEAPEFSIWAFMSSPQNVFPVPYCFPLYPRYNQVYFSIQFNITEQIVLKDLMMGPDMVHSRCTPSCAKSAPLTTMLGNNNSTSLPSQLTEAEV